MLDCSRVFADQRRRATGRQGQATIKAIANRTKPSVATTGGSGTPLTVPLPRSLAKANRFALNPVVRLVAGWLPGFAIVRHRGRRSGREYATPINIFRIPSGFTAALTYGPGTDWLKNLTAAGGGTIRHRGREIRVGEPVFVSTAEGMAAMPWVVGHILRATNTTAFVRWEEVDGARNRSRPE